MTADEKKKVLSVCTVPGPLFDITCREAWGLADRSRSVFHSCKEPLIIDSRKPYAEQLAELVRAILEAEYFAELPNEGEIVYGMEAMTGKQAALDILGFVSARWQYIHTQEAIDRAKAWTAGRNIFEEIDRLNPDSLYRYFHKTTKTLDEATDAAFLYGYEMGLAAAREGAQP